VEINSTKKLSGFFRALSYASYTVSITILSLGIVEYIFYENWTINAQIIKLFLFLILLVILAGFFIYIFEKKLESSLMGISR